MRRVSLYDIGPAPFCGARRRTVLVDKQAEGRRIYYETNNGWNFNKPHSR
jgi:hypothetical protein